MVAHHGRVCRHGEHGDAEDAVRVAQSVLEASGDVGVGIVVFAHERFGVGGGVGDRGDGVVAGVEAPW